MPHVSRAVTGAATSDRISRRGHAAESAAIFPVATVHDRRQDVTDSRRGSATPPSSTIMDRRHESYVDDTYGASCNRVMRFDGSFKGAARLRPYETAQNLYGPGSADVGEASSAGLGWPGSGRTIACGDTSALPPDSVGPTAGLAWS